MEKYHPKQELAPRDVVARAIHQEMVDQESDCVYLDISQRPAAWIEERFPKILRECLKYGIDMRRQQLADGVHLVSGVRTGFRHMVVETDQGLIVADAPAGWVELHQLPASDLVPGFSISGLSENFIDFLQQ